MKEWLQQPGEGFKSLLALRPELQQKYQEFLAVVENNDAVPEAVYELCRAHIQYIHGLRTEDVDQSHLNAGESAALVAADRMPFQHHQLTDDEVDAVKSAFGNEGCVALLTALAFFDVTCRLEATFQASQMSNQ